MMGTDTATRDRLGRLLADLCAAPGPPGFEASIREVLHKAWAPVCDQILVSPLGNLYALSRGTGEGARPSVAVVAHMDTIGFMVKDVVGGFIRLAGLGTPDARVLAGQRVIVRGRDPVPGVIVLPPESATSDRARDTAFELAEMWVDVGRSAENVDALIRTGDTVVFDQPIQALGQALMTGPGLDNRASLAALTEALTRLKGQAHAWDVWAVASTSEERSMSGAATAGFHLSPDMAIVLDVTFGRGTGDPKSQTFPVGSGLTNGVGPQLHPAVHAIIDRCAERAGVPIVDEILPQQTGTDADVIQVSAGGIACGLISLPVRNLHTAVEVVHLDDIVRMAAVLVELLLSLSADDVIQLDAAYNHD